MTKKDYEKIAGVLRKHWFKAKLVQSLLLRQQVEMIAEDFGEVLREDNERFDVERFMDEIKNSY